MSIEKKMISAVSLDAAMAEVVKAAQEGFELDPDFRPRLYGYIFKVGMVRDTEVGQEADNLLVQTADGAISAVVKRPGRPKKA